jgi:hypothetical protein
MKIQENNNKPGRIPFILAQNNTDTCYEGGDSACPPRTAPAQWDSAVITFPGVIALGEPSGGVKPP